VNGLRDLDQLEAVAAFREYQFHWPERVGLDAIRDAERLGAVARNYTKARLSTYQKGQGWTVELTDVIASAAPVQVRARVVLNMAGVWIDEILRETSPHVGRKVFGTKGCHIVVTLPESCLGSGIATLNSEDEPFYCVPWGRFHYFGPTETPYEGDYDRVFVTEDEMMWLIREANHLLPGLKLTAADVRMTWAGVRPLTYDEAIPFGNRSRTIHDLSGNGLPDVFAMTAGPLMTHRSAGREMTRLVAQRMAPTGQPQLPDYAPPPSAEPDAEHSVTLSDFLFRRRGTAWFGPVSDADLERSAAELGSMLGWDEARVREEAEAFRAEWDSLFNRPGSRTSAERFTAPGAHGNPTELLPASRS
jgi:glycerol-3-phosphate dehydrogenase